MKLVDRADGKRVVGQVYLSHGGAKPAYRLKEMTRVRVGVADGDGRFW